MEASETSMTIGPVSCEQPLTELSQRYEVYSTPIHHPGKWLIQGRCVYSTPAFQQGSTYFKRRESQQVCSTVCPLSVLGGRTEEADSQGFERVSLHGMDTPHTTQLRDVESRILGSPRDAAKRLIPTLNRAICCFAELHRQTVA